MIEQLYSPGVVDDDEDDDVMGDDVMGNDGVVGGGEVAGGGGPRIQLALVVTRHHLSLGP